MVNLITSLHITELARLAATSAVKAELDARSNTTNKSGKGFGLGVVVTVATLAFTILAVMLAMLSLEIQTNQATRKTAEDLWKFEKEFIEKMHKDELDQIAESAPEDRKPLRNGIRKRQSHRRKVIGLVESETHPVMTPEHQAENPPDPARLKDNL
jgi:hypothetical protein